MKNIITPIQIRFSDVDKLGHVNNAVYLSYLELARMNYFKDVVGKINWNKEGVIVARVEMDFVQSVMLNDKIFVKTWCSRTGNKSFDLSYSLFKKEGDEETEMLKGLTVMVCFNYELKKSVEMPEAWRKWLTE